MSERRGCEPVRRLLSARLDGALRTAERERLDRHLEACPDCAAVAAELDRLRSALRVAPVGPVPDIATGVRESLEARGRGPRRAARVALRAAAAFVVASAFGAGIALLTTVPQVAVADLPTRVGAAQGTVSALSARLEIIEHGWHPEVPARRYEGTIAYRSPETLVLELEDRTDYPDERWVGNDMRVVLTDDAAWRSGAARCPFTALPACTPPAPRITGEVNRAPFSEGARALDLIVPVRSFLDAETSVTEERTVGGREALGVRISAGQAAPLLDALLGAGDGREVHPSDPVELWLDAAHLVPLRVLVRAADGGERERWARRLDLRDRPGAVLLEIHLHDLALNEDADPPSPPPVPDGLRDAGFRPLPFAEVGAPIPGWLPDGLEAHRAGVVRTAEGSTIAMRSWSDGRAWVRMRATSEWAGGRLFGDLGRILREVDLGGVAYVGEGGDRVAIHTPEVDVVVEGSVGTDTLLEIAASLGIAGRSVPADWADAATGTIAEAARTVRGLLVPAGVDGFGEPGVRVDGETVVLAYHGPGARGFLVTQGPGDALGPPLDADVRGVLLRGTTARYTPARGELEWVEDGDVVTLRSRTLTLEELVAVAESMHAVGSEDP